MARDGSSVILCSIKEKKMAIPPILELKRSRFAFGTLEALSLDSIAPQNKADFISFGDWESNTEADSFNVYILHRLVGRTTSLCCIQKYREETGYFEAYIHNHSTGVHGQIILNRDDYLSTWYVTSGQDKIDYYRTFTLQFNLPGVLHKYVGFEESKDKYLIAKFNRAGNLEEFQTSWLHIRRNSTTSPMGYKKLPSLEDGKLRPINCGKDWFILPF
jgi:hypothetical protein